MHQGRNLRATLERRRLLRSNQTEAESKLWRRLRDKRLNGYKFVRQYGTGPFVLDFFCPQKQLAIEVDGGQHNMTIGKANDKDRSEYLKNCGIRVIRFWNHEVTNEISAVLETIAKELR